MPSQRFRVGDEIVIRPLTQTIGALRGRHGIIRQVNIPSANLTIELTDDQDNGGVGWKKGDRVYVSPWEVAKK